MEKKSESDDAVISFLYHDSSLCLVSFQLISWCPPGELWSILPWLDTTPAPGQGGVMPHTLVSSAVSPLLTLSPGSHHNCPDNTPSGTLAIASCRHSHSLDFCSCQLWEEHWGHANLYSSPQSCVCVRCIISEVGYCEWRPCHSNNITRPLWWSLLSSAGQLLTSNTVSSHSVLGYNSSSWSSIGHSVLYLVGTTQRIHWSGLRYNYNGDMWENLYILDLSILYSPELNVC